MISDKNFNNFYLNNLLTEKNGLSDFNERINIVKNQIKVMKWSDLIVTEINSLDGTTNRSFEVSFSENIKNQIFEIKDTYEALEHFSDIVEDSLLGAGKSLEMTFKIQVSEFSNRIDITGNGITPGFRGLGLGCKLYRKII